jgi:hypothetical protein
MKKSIKNRKIFLFNFLNLILFCSEFYTDLKEKLFSRHQREREDLQKRHQNELVQLLLSQSKYSYSIMSINNDHLSNKDQ